jgi:hypothetical protein
MRWGEYKGARCRREKVRGVETVPDTVPFTCLIKADEEEL